MMAPEDLIANLAQFTGSDAVHRHLGPVVLTDGAKYLAENAKAYWLMDIIASYAPLMVQCGDWLYSAHLRKVGATGAMFELKGCPDARGQTRAIVHQEIQYTDFPLERISLYVSTGRDSPVWVVMLPGEL